MICFCFVLLNKFFNNSLSAITYPSIKVDNLVKGRKSCERKIKKKIRTEIQLVFFAR